MSFEIRIEFRGFPRAKLPPPNSENNSKAGAEKYQMTQRPLYPITQPNSFE